MHLFHWEVFVLCVHPLELFSYASHRRCSEIYPVMPIAITGVYSVC